MEASNSASQIKPFSSTFSGSSNYMGVDHAKHKSTISHKADRAITDLQDSANVLNSAICNIIKIIDSAPPGMDLVKLRLAYASKMKDLNMINKTIRTIQQLLPTMNHTPAERPKQIPSPQSEIQTFNETINKIFADINMSVKNFEDGMLRHCASIGSNLQQMSNQKNTLTTVSTPTVPAHTAPTPIPTIARTDIPTNSRTITCTTNAGNDRTGTYARPRSANWKENRAKPDRANTKKFCNFHRVTSHNTEDCRAANGVNGAPSTPVTHDKKRRRFDVTAPNTERPK